MTFEDFDCGEPSLNAFLLNIWCVSTMGVFYEATCLKIAIVRVSWVITRCREAVLKSDASF
jgi:hypothetical protein